MNKKLPFFFAFLFFTFLGFSQSKISDLKFDSNNISNQVELKKVNPNTQINSNKLASNFFKNAIIPLDGLVGLYDLDDNTYIDSSDSGFDMGLIGAGGFILPSQNRFGTPDKAIYLLDEYIDLATNPTAFNFDSDSNFSICTWIKIEETIVDWTAFINNWNGFGTGGYYLGFTPTQQIRWNVNGDFPVDSDPVQTGVWIHVAVTYDGFNANLWLDGVLVGSETNSVPIVASPLPFTVGAQADVPTNIFPGVIDEILIYERVLTGDEIADIFSTLSNEDLEAFSAKINVYPNPTNASLTISYDNSLNTIDFYEVNDVEGKIILQSEFNGLSNSINLDNLNSGVYFINLVTSDGFSIVKKVIKK